jgi:hypothetical protein
VSFARAPGRRAGDVPALERQLAEDVVAWADGGGKAPAMRHPVVGRAQVLRSLLALAGQKQWIRMTTFTVGTVNGEPALVLHADGRLLGVVVPEFDGEHIVAIRTIANPDKLAFSAKQTT